MRYIKSREQAKACSFLILQSFFLEKILIIKEKFWEAILLENWVGMKELYDINIRVNQPVTFCGKKFEVNETILNFERAEIAQINENKSRTRILGGFNNNLLMDWETDREIGFGITHGILSSTSLALLSNSTLSEKENISVPFQEKIKTMEENGEWYILLKYIPNHISGSFGIQGNPENEQMPMGRRDWLPLKPLPPIKDKFIFCYDAESGKKILNFDIIGNKIIFKAQHNEIFVDYTFNYGQQSLQLNMGNILFNGFLNLTAKMTTKNYMTGEPATAVLLIPKIKLQSSILLQLGSQLDCAAVSDFTFIGYPEEGRHKDDQVVCRMYFLPTELTGDYL